jgi:predicted HicB family RNase H-like nuclease
MVNINITLPDELHKKLKVAAAMSDNSLKDFINNALEKKMSKRKR